MAKDAFDLNELKAAFGDLKRSATGGGGGASGGPTIEARRGGGFPWAIVLPLIIVAWLLLQSFVVVGAGERAVIFNRFRGVQNGELGEGLHFLAALRAISDDLRCENANLHHEQPIKTNRIRLSATPAMRCWR